MHTKETKVISIFIDLADGISLYILYNKSPARHSLYRDGIMDQDIKGDLKKLARDTEVRLARTVPEVEV